MLKPAVTMVQETKLYRKGTFKLENYCVFEKVRENKEGGGLMTVIHENLEPVLIPTKNSSKNSLDVLVVEAKVINCKIRFINSYGVQENCIAEERAEFYSILEAEILSTLEWMQMQNWGNNIYRVILMKCPQMESCYCVCLKDTTWL